MNGEPPLKRGVARAVEAINKLDPLNAGFGGYFLMINK